MKRPLFSCVVPVKGARPFMDAALASLSAQEMGDDLEVIVQDGDAEPDAGQSDALNKGFVKAHGDWLFWRLRLWRVLCGCYLREWVDACRWMGRNLDALG